MEGNPDQSPENEGTQTVGALGDEARIDTSDQGDGLKPRKGSKRAIIIAVAAVIVVGGIGAWYFGLERPHEAAVSDFQSAASSVEDNNSELKAETDSLQDVIDSQKQPLDASKLANAQAAVADARDAMRSIPDMPQSTSDIAAAANALGEPLDYSDRLSSLSSCKSELKDSIRQLEQVTNPTEKFVIESLGTVPTITGTAAATEGNDPNRHLNKQGGYTASVFFADSLVDAAKLIHGGDIIENGTDGGGCIEVYRTAEDASKRNDYLAVLDGGLFDSGSHKVIGTVLVRTSSNLTATQQNELESQIVASLTALR